MATLPLPVYPGIALRNGAFGPDTALVQTQLSGLGFPTSIDGIYGPATKAAVRKFQSIFGLPATGIVDYPTWYKISEVYVGVSRIAELN